MISKKMFIRPILGITPLLGLLHGCTERFETDFQRPAQGTVIRMSAETFRTEGAPAPLPGEETIGQIGAYVFEKGVLTAIHSDLSLSENGCDLSLERLGGTLYIVADAPIDRPGAGFPEAEWRRKTVSMNPDAPQPFLTGVLDLDALPAGSALVPLPLTRGVARFDLRLKVAGEAAVRKFTIKNAARQAYLFAQAEPLET